MPEPARRHGDAAIFFREFLRHPVQTGAVLPSSPALAQVAISPLTSAGDPLVVELGPGTGAFTGAIQQRLAGHGTHLAIDTNPRLAALLSDRFPEVTVINDDAVRLPDLLAERGLGGAELIVSSLPWAGFGEALQERLLVAAIEGLADGGTFTTFAYVHGRVLPSAARFYRRLQTCFGEVTVSPIVWRNAPPAVVYFARSASTS
ncbi:class I SAM-dependent methyltransferase [Luteipulveratus mongoliensis]|uniref:SAM-dependent methyltransferase n=1 Tax=Luteipulveratus mongoliensis TaxID=571913 RepID=A0A0K1JL58_9MICO|nr:SAM-dependent methyltransferase [Luteipulveratus mongoliensis]AKU17308.1 SAM-dependent methyltransferase [Luteipulveratus mongoliensis]